MKFFVATDLTVTHGKIMALNELGSTMPTYFFAKLSFNSILNFLKLRPESKSDVFVEFSPMPLIKFVIVFNWRFSSIKTSCFSDSFSLFSIIILFLNKIS